MRTEAAGGAFRALPFPGAVYLVDTGENHSTASVQKGRGQTADFATIAAEFGLRQYDAVHGWAVWAMEQLDAAAAARR